MEKKCQSVILFACYVAYDGFRFQTGCCILVMYTFYAHLYMFNVLFSMHHAQLSAQFVR